MVDHILEQLFHTIVLKKYLYPIMLKCHLRVNVHYLVSVNIQAKGKAHISRKL